MAVTLEKPRVPSTFFNAQLLAMDFDGTVAQTFEKSPSGVGVHEAYDVAVELVFGIDGLTRYVKAGGLRNRAPIEVVNELAPDASIDEVEALTGSLTNAKLGVLMREVGTRFDDGCIWPRPTEGYFEICENISVAVDDAGAGFVDSAIISSGHEPFVVKTYRAWGIPEPEHIIGQDTTKKIGPELGLSSDRLVKPSIDLMGIAHRLWRQSYGLDFYAKLDERLRERTVYVGDDLAKDGGMAAASGVDFYHLGDPNNSMTWKRVAKRLGLLSRTGQHG